MGWHTSALCIEGTHDDNAEVLLASLGFPGLRPVGTISGDGAGGSDLHGKAIAVVAGWTLLWDALMFVTAEPAGMLETGIWPASLDSALAELSKTNRVYSFITESASTTHGFCWYTEGERRRLWLSQEYETYLDEGEPLAEEVDAIAADPDEEGRLFEIMRRLTGVSMDEVLATEFRVFA